MDNDIKTWLFDILNAMMEIETFFIGQPKQFEYFKNDLKTKRAVERNLEIIGEALSRIIKRDNTFNITNARQIVDTRNRIIHGYDLVSDEIIWSIVDRHLPVLRGEVTALLNA
jgi:uncharacterized protein with HEPN domain